LVEFLSVLLGRQALHFGDIFKVLGLVKESPQGILASIVETIERALHPTA
jgi:hypothetical protein